MADLITPKDDDRLWLGSTVSNIEVSGNIVTWTVETELSTTPRPGRDCLVAEIDDGLIRWIEPRDCEEPG